MILSDRPILLPDALSLLFILVILSPWLRLTSSVLCINEANGFNTSHVLFQISNPNFAGLTKYLKKNSKNLSPHAVRFY